eukprot:6189323-Pleurochrysis_carterae.AAC.5
MTFKRGFSNEASAPSQLNQAAQRCANRVRLCAPTQLPHLESLADRLLGLRAGALGCEGNTRGGKAVKSEDPTTLRAKTESVEAITWLSVDRSPVQPSAHNPNKAITD